MHSLDGEKSHFVPLNLPFSVVFKVPISFNAGLNNLAEFLCKHVVIEQVVHVQTRSRWLYRVRRTDAPFGHSDAMDVQIKANLCTMGRLLTWIIPIRLLLI